MKSALELVGILSAFAGLFSIVAYFWCTWSHKIRFVFHFPSMHRGNLYLVGNPKGRLLIGIEFDQRKAAVLTKLSVCCESPGSLHFEVAPFFKAVPHPSGKGVEMVWKDRYSLVKGHVVYFELPYKIISTPPYFNFRLQIRAEGEIDPGNWRFPATMFGPPVQSKSEILKFTSIVEPLSPKMLLIPIPPGQSVGLIGPQAKEALFSYSPNYKLAVTEIMEDGGYNYFSISKEMEQDEPTVHLE